KPGETLPRADAICGQQCIQLTLIRVEARPVGVRMPEVKHGRAQAAVAAPHAMADHAHENIGVLAAPAGEGRIEAVNCIKVVAPERHVAPARAAPATCLSSSR